MDKRKKITLGTSALAIWVSVAATTFSHEEQRLQASLPAGRAVLSVPAQAIQEPASQIVSMADSIKKDPETGLVVDDQLLLVKGQCTACHSSKLILQSHFSREKWIERIRWMQRTQKLWDLGESEPAIVSYLVKHYGPVERTFDGRREPLTGVKWHKLSD